MITILFYWYVVGWVSMALHCLWVSQQTSAQLTLCEFIALMIAYPALIVLMPFLLLASAVIIMPMTVMSEDTIIEDTCWVIWRKK